MKNELTVLKALRDVIDAGLNPTPPQTKGDPEPTPVEKIPVVIDFPSVDKMPAKKTVYLIPDYAEYETLATTNDRADFRVAMFILCKRAPKADLVTDVYNIYNQIYDLLRRNMDLGGVVDFTEVQSATFYPAVEMNESVQGIESTVSITYTKDFE